MEDHYNLLDEDWIPVLFNNGATRRVGIREAFAEAQRIRQIAATNPMDRLAILRFLLAVLYWCKGNPPKGVDATFKGPFPPELLKEITEHREEFNLLGEGTRFYQRRTASGKEGKLSANYLIQEVPTGINCWHFHHATDDSDGLCEACCAMGLLRLPLFATSAGRGKPPGVNRKPPVYVIPLGDSLAETLCLSWNTIPGSELGAPTWEQPDIVLPSRGVVPWLTGLTWVPRLVWLDDPTPPEANCTSCGRKRLLVRQCVFAGVGSAKGDGDDEDRIWSDPHTIRNRKGDVMSTSSALAGADASAGKWADIVAGILTSGFHNTHRKLWVVSFATVQNDKYLEARELEVALGAAPEPSKLEGILATIQKWQDEGWKVVRKAKPREALQTRKHLEIPPLVAAIRPQVEARVSQRIVELVTQGGEAWQQAACEYGPMMAAVAKSLAPGFTTAALQKRRHIAVVKPDMCMDEKPAAKGVAKKGGIR